MQRICSFLDGNKTHEARELSCQLWAGFDAVFIATIILIFGANAQKVRLFFSYVFDNRSLDIYIPRFEWTARMRSLCIFTTHMRGAKSLEFDNPCTRRLEGTYLLTCVGSRSFMSGCVAILLMITNYLECAFTLPHSVPGSPKLIVTQVSLIISTKDARISVSPATLVRFSSISIAKFALPNELRFIRMHL